MLPSLLYLRLKRLIDLAAAIVVAPVFLVVIALAAIAIKLDDRGPVFFIQSRMGFRGEPFEVVKLRTMTVGADRQGAKFTAENDPRITRIGQYLAQVPHR